MDSRFAESAIEVSYQIALSVDELPMPLKIAQG
jgi:hypothetical protein